MVSMTKENIRRSQGPPQQRKTDRMDIQFDLNGRRATTGAQRLPTDLSTCLGPRALLNLCLDAVQQLPENDLRAARARHPETRPEMLITLLTYCYSVGIYDSRDIEAASRTDRTLRYICAGARPDWQTLRRFRRYHRSILQASLVHVMKQTWAFQFETGEADYVGYDWFETQLVEEFTQTATVRLDLAALLDGLDAY
jgi:hypothetical protein